MERMYIECIECRMERVSCNETKFCKIYEHIRFAYKCIFSNKNCEERLTDCFLVRALVYRARSYSVDISLDSWCGHFLLSLNLKISLLN